MPEVQVGETVVVLHLSTLERLGALHGDVVIPRPSIRSARVAANPWSELRGLRAPGTGWPGRIALGTWRGRFGRDFFAVFGREPAVVLELRDQRFARVVVSVPDPGAIVAALGTL